MRCTCKQCGREYEYNDSVGYDKELCGPYCDGFFWGLKRGEQQNTTFRELLARAKIHVGLSPLESSEKLWEEINEALGSSE